MLLKQGILVGSIFLLFWGIVSASICVATEVTVVFQDVKGRPLVASSVTIVNADVFRVGEDLRVTGLLKRPHPLPMAGHLHVYTYSVDSELTAESKHRVPGLNSKRRGMMRISFNVLLDEVPAGATKVLLEYHSPGHQES